MMMFAFAYERSGVDSIAPSRQISGVVAHSRLVGCVFAAPNFIIVVNLQRDTRFSPVNLFLVSLFPVLFLALLGAIIMKMMMMTVTTVMMCMICPWLSICRCRRSLAARRA